jgi:hypothetical protein
MDKISWIKPLVRATVAGIIWFMAFFVIRKGLNPKNYTDEPWEKFKLILWDAIFGGSAAAV